MKALGALVGFFLLSNGCLLAGGSIDWKEVRGRVSKQDPELIRVIEAAFEVSRVGDALRLGPHSSPLEGKAGERVPPYTFYCRLKKEREPQKLMLILNLGDDGWQFTIRRKTARD